MGSLLDVSTKNKPLGYLWLEVCLFLAPKNCQHELVSSVRHFRFRSLKTKYSIIGANLSVLVNQKSKISTIIPTLRVYSWLIINVIAMETPIKKAE